MTFLPTKPMAFKAIFLCAFLLAGAALLLPAFMPATNCGGNSAALSACKGILLSFRIASGDHGDKPVSIADLNRADRENFRFIAGLSWLPDSKILVTSGPVLVGEMQSKEIVAVCNHPFDNVPQRFLGKAPMSHAVAYTDGSTGLISVDEFARLDLKGFLDVKSIPTPDIK
ncbi:MAG TPA: hypothetical protein VN281_12440 [Verrucomicrobiae bacterium]|nr:hypothetical protein [Verrucomicrobiae bacterium]